MCFESWQYHTMQLCKQKGLDCCRKCFCEIIQSFYLSKHILHKEYTNASFCFTLVFLLAQFFVWCSCECCWQHKEGGGVGVKPAAAQQGCGAGELLLFHSVVFCVKFKFSWISKLIRQYLIIVLLQQLCMRWLGCVCVCVRYLVLPPPPSVETLVLSAILLTSFSAPSP